MMLGNVIFCTTMNENIVDIIDQKDLYLISPISTEHGNLKIFISKNMFCRMNINILRSGDILM